MNEQMARPTRRRRMLVPAITAINIFVFALWNYHLGASRQFMETNFLASWNSLAVGNYFSLLGSAFSHISFLHLFINMFVLNNFGSLLESILGPKAFLTFYLLTGIISSATHCVVSRFLMLAPDLPVLGASGAISGLVIVFSLMFSKEKLLLLGFIPVPALVGALIFVGLDLWGLFEQAHGGGLPIGHGAHLGGALCGAAYYFFILKKKMNTRSPLSI